MFQKCRGYHDKARPSNFDLMKKPVSNHAYIVFVRHSSRCLFLEIYQLMPIDVRYAFFWNVSGTSLINEPFYFTAAELSVKAKGGVHFLDTVCAGRLR